MISLKDNLKIQNNLTSSLEKDYDEALKNDDFKLFVSKIKLTRSTLIKYTSSLEESFNEYFNCKNCKNV